MRELDLAHFARPRPSLLFREVDFALAAPRDFAAPLFDLAAALFEDFAARFAPLFGAVTLPVFGFFFAVPAVVVAFGVVFPSVEEGLDFTFELDFDFDFDLDP